MGLFFIYGRWFLWFTVSLFDMVFVTVFYVTKENVVSNSLIKFY